MSKKLTLFDPISRGLRADGQVCSMRVATPMHGARHKGVVGMNGSGKTAGEVPTMIVAAARGANLWVLDVQKLWQSYGDVWPIFNAMIPDQGLVVALLERMMTHVIPARTAAFARQGHKLWKPDCDEPFLIMQFEEAWNFAGNCNLVDLAATARSAGVQIVVSQQRFTHDRMDTSLRAELPDVCHYGIKNKEDVRYGLPDELADAGANPAAWRNDHPGMHYVAQVGIPIDEQLLEVRSWDDPGRLDPETSRSFKAVAARIGQNIRPMGPVTVKALGDLWKHMVPPAELARRALGPVASTAVTIPVGPPVPPLAPTSPAEPVNTGDDMPTMTQELPPIAEFSADGSQLVFTGNDGLPPDAIDLGPEPDPSLVVNPREPIPALPLEAAGIDLEDLGRPAVGQTKDPDATPKEEYEEALQARLEELMTSGELILTAQFRDLYQTHKRTRPTINAWLVKQEKDKVIVRVMSGTKVGYLPVRQQAA